MTNLKKYLRMLMNIMMTSGLIMIYKPVCALVYFRYQEDFKSYWLNWSERCPGRWSPTSYYERRTHRGRSVFSLLMTPCLVSVTMLQRSQTLGDSTASLASSETSYCTPAATCSWPSGPASASTRRWGAVSTRLGGCYKLRVVEWFIAWTWQNFLQHSEIRLANNLVCYLQQASLWT